MTRVSERAAAERAARLADLQQRARTARERLSAARSFYGTSSPEAERADTALFRAERAVRTFTNGSSR